MFKKLCLKMFSNKRIFFIKCIIIAFALYLFIYIFNNSGTTEIIRELQQSGRNLAALDPQRNAFGEQLVQAIPLLEIHEKSPQIEPTKKVVTEPSFNEKLKVIPIVSSAPQEPAIDPVLKVTHCLDKPTVSKTQQRGDYWVLYNYVPAKRRFRCHETITYTTHGDFSFLDNLVPLVERWNGPISIALHAPGTDFSATVDSMAYLRDCTSALVGELVTFHIYFSTKHIPKQVPHHDKVLSESYNCSLPSPFYNVSSEQMYKAQKKLLYPVNVGRNIAREMAETHFILASDIELYPSPAIIPQFLKIIGENSGPLLRKNPKVFPLHLFEVSANQQVPDNKTALKEMLQNGTAVPFHKKLCPGCHNVPKSKEWQNANETKGLHIFHIGKRTGYFLHWEPIFIGTNAEPLYDERLSWEGKSDKMTQGYALCVLDYDFLILDNAFLVHKPGIKIYKNDPKRNILASKTNQLIKKIIFPELRVLYGIKKGCAV